MGKITWVAIGIYILMIIIQFIVTGFSQGIRTNIMKTIDTRVKLVNEILTGIRVIKYYCWEKPFKGKVSDIRDVELNLHKKIAYLMYTGIDLLMTIIPQLVPLACFSLYPSVMGKPLTSSVAFTSISLFSILQMPFAMMPMCMMLSVQFKSVEYERYDY